MATLANVKRLAAKFSAIVEDIKIGDTHSCEVCAPHRKIWACGDLHALLDVTNRPWKPDYADLIDRMNYGLEDCTIPDCDWCNSKI